MTEIAGLKRPDGRVVESAAGAEVGCLIASIKTDLRKDFEMKMIEANGANIPGDRARHLAT